LIRVDKFRLWAGVGTGTGSCLVAGFSTGVLISH